MNNGKTWINYPPQLVQDVSHQQYQFKMMEIAHVNDKLGPQMYGNIERYGHLWLKNLKKCLAPVVPNWLVQTLSRHTRFCFNMWGMKLCSNNLLMYACVYYSTCMYEKIIIYIHIGIQDRHLYIVCTYYVYQNLIEGSLNRNFRQYGQLKSRCIAQQ